MWVYYWIWFSCTTTGTQQSTTSADTWFQRNTLAVPPCIEGIHEEFWNGTSLLSRNKIQTKKMPVKTCTQSHMNVTWINIRDFKWPLERCSAFSCNKNYVNIHQTVLCISLRLKIVLNVLKRISFRCMLACWQSISSLALMVHCYICW